MCQRERQRLILPATVATVTSYPVSFFLPTVLTVPVRYHKFWGIWAPTDGTRVAPALIKEKAATRRGVKLASAKALGIFQGICYFLPHFSNQMSSISNEDPSAWCHPPGGSNIKIVGAPMSEVQYKVPVICR